MKLIYAFYPRIHHNFELWSHDFEVKSVFDF